jgi:hypothetical protein
VHSVVESMDEWGLHYHIKGLCFDKMACNMGNKRWSVHLVGERDWQRTTKFGMSLPSHVGDHAGTFQHPWCVKVTQKFGHI